MSWKGEFNYSVHGNYVFSNQATIEPANIPPEFHARIVQAKGKPIERKLTGQSFLNWLTRHYKLPHVKLVVEDFPRLRHGNTEYLGWYSPSTMLIRIYNRTAVRHDIISDGRFVDTLVHEFMHHFDTYGLHIESIHTAGFYKRIHTLRDCFYNKNH